MQVVNAFLPTFGGMNSCRIGYNSAANFGFLIFLQYLNHFCFGAIIYAGMLGTDGIKYSELIKYTCINTKI